MRTAKTSSVPTSLNVLVLLHCNLYDVQFFLNFFAAVLKKSPSDSTRLTQGPIWHHPTRGIIHGQ
jgi:hypothetical protein